MKLKTILRGNGETVSFAENLRFIRKVIIENGNDGKFSYIIEGIYKNNLEGVEGFIYKTFRVFYETSGEYVDVSTYNEPVRKGVNRVQKVSLEMLTPNGWVELKNEKTTMGKQPLFMANHDEHEECYNEILSEYADFISDIF
jgi:hypothetical protein